MSVPCVSLENVSKRFGSAGGLKALDRVTVAGMAGELILLLGPSGSGKTTLLLLAAGFDAPSSGVIRLFGRGVATYTQKTMRVVRAQRIGFIFQNHRLLHALKARENVALTRSFFPGKPPIADHAVEEAMVSANIIECSERKVCDLSQGEQQRVAIARSIVNTPALLLADEPTASLGSTQSLDLFRFFQAYAHQKHACVIVASHDERLRAFADRIVHMTDGTIFEDGAGKNR